MRPISSFDALKGLQLRGLRLLAGSFFLARFTPDLGSCALLTREFAGGSRIPISTLSRGLELQMKEGFPDSACALLGHIINVS